MGAPPPAVLAAFGAGAAEPVPLGDRAAAWRAGAVVLKRLDMAEPALAWQAEVLRAVRPDGFRVAVPLRSRAGRLVVDGWTAWPLLEGVHAERWDDIVAVGEPFHRALAGVPRPGHVLDARTDAWARADRAAWGESAAAGVARSASLARLVAARRPVDARSQLIHGDLSGNVLFADGLPPAVIDLAPYWRPAAYAAAIVRVDAVLWHGAGAGSLVASPGQLVLRALLFRLLVEADPAAAAAGRRPVIDHVCRLAGG